MFEVINLEKLSADGYKMLANDPNAGVPNEIGFARLQAFSTGGVSQGLFQGQLVAGANSTFVFDINLERLLIFRFKLFLSADGITYYEEKTWGGADGIILTKETGLECAGAIVQSSVAAPNIAIQNNNTGITFTGSYISVGTYTLTANPIITTINSQIIVLYPGLVTDLTGQVGNIFFDLSTPSFLTSGVMDIYTRNMSNVLTDNILTNGVDILIKIWR